MEITIEMPSENQEFTVSITGISHDNPDGTNRQKILSRSKEGEIVNLVRERDNQFDKSAVGVLNQKGEMIGYLPKGDRLSMHLDCGGIVSAKIGKITGGPTFLEKILKKQSKSYGCVLLINKGGFDWDVVTPLMEESKEIEKILEKAKKHESSNAELSIKNYRSAITKILEMDSKGILAASWRRARYPINRLSLVLEKNNEFDEAYEEIIKYEKFEDKYGILKTDISSLEKRKLRLEKKLEGIS